jgi:phospholipid transport system transporter-binding protein
MIECAHGRCRVQGPVTVSNVQAVLAEGLRLMAGQDVVLDLKGMTEADSSAVSLLLEWSRAAAASGHTIRFENPNSNLRTLVTLYDVGELLPGL